MDVKNKGNQFSIELDTQEMLYFNKGLNELFKALLSDPGAVMDHSEGALNTSLFVTKMIHNNINDELIKEGFPDECMSLGFDQD